MPHASHGVLITSDEPTIEFIKYVDETDDVGRFIISCIDTRNVFVQHNALDRIQRAIRERDRKNTYTKTDFVSSMNDPKDKRSKSKRK